MAIPNSSTPLLSRSLGFPRASSTILRTGAAFVALGMIAGAFGAHGLKKRGDIKPDSIQSWQTASHYVVFNGLGLLFLSLHPRLSSYRFAAPAIIGGGIVFSGSIMALVLAGDSLRFLGPITPLGGLAMISGYISLVL